MLDTHYARRAIGPELRLVSNPECDHSHAGHEEAADFILMLCLPSQPALVFPFFTDRDLLAAFAHGWLSTLSGPEYKSARQPQEHIPGAHLRDVMLNSHDFLAKALGDCLDAFVEALEDLPAGNALRVYGDHNVPINFPWEVLHPWPVPSTAALEIDGLLGARFLLPRWSQDVPDVLSADIYVHDVLSPGPKSYAFVDDDMLPSVQKKVERDALSSYVGTAFHPLSRDGEGLENPGSLISYLLLSRTAVHFSCHGSVGAVGADAKKYRFRVRNNAEIGTSWLKTQIEARSVPDIGARAGGRSRLLFLNICNSISRTGTHDKSPVTALRAMNPWTVIGTQGEVCDTLAADFAVRFYEKALKDRAPVGAAFLTALRDRLKTTLNPAHLLFVMKGQTDVLIH